MTRVSWAAYHVTMPIERLHPCQKFLIVPQGYEDLGMIPHGLLKYGQWSLADLVLLEGSNLRFVEVRLWLVRVLTVVKDRFTISGGIAYASC